MIDNTGQQNLTLTPPSLSLPPAPPRTSADELNSTFYAEFRYVYRIFLSGRVSKIQGNLNVHNSTLCAYETDRNFPLKCRGIWLSPSPDGVSTLTWWGSLRASGTPRDMPVVVWLPARTPKPDRSKGRSQTKRDTLALQVGGWVQGQHPRPRKTSIPLKRLNYWKMDG